MGCGRMIVLADAMCPGCGRFLVGDLSHDYKVRRAAEREGGGGLVIAALFFGMITLFVVWIAHGTYQRARVGAKHRDAMEAVRDAHAVAESWRVDHPGSCPTMPELLSAGALPPATKVNDPWGRPYRIECAPEETRVVSEGPDGRSGTGDDIARSEHGR